MVTYSMLLEEVTHPQLHFLTILQKTLGQIFHPWCMEEKAGLSVIGGVLTAFGGESIHHFLEEFAEIG